MVTWRPAGFERYVFPTAEELPTRFERRRVPSIQAIITVSTRLGWHQRTLDELFSRELDDRLMKIGVAERSRVGLRHRIVVTATAMHSDSVQILTWEPGHLYPELDEHQHVHPPFWRPTGFDEHGDPTGFEGDENAPTLSPGQLLDPVRAYVRRQSADPLRADPGPVDPNELDPVAPHEG